MPKKKVANKGSWQKATTKKEYARIPGFESDEEHVIQSLTAGDLIEWSEANEGEAKRTAGLRLIVKSVVDGEPGVDDGATGDTLLSDKDLGMLRGLPHKDTENVVREILKLNGMNVPVGAVKNG